MRQVWTNLIDNALKFSRQAEPPRIEVGGERSGGELRYWVKDNGMGYDPAHAGKLWGVFERLHTADEAPPGTGIGLAIVKRIVERHGGTVRAEGAPGKGATFGFTLPA
jgi:signal transduction histidine kinase